jgi:hypothetical protein
MGMPTRSEYLTIAMRLKNEMVERARGSDPHPSEYATYRQMLVNAPGLSKLVPKCVQVNRSIREFWVFIKPLFPTYAQREQYLKEQFDPLLTILESQEASPSEDETSATIADWDTAHVLEAWEKARNRRDSDPDGAVTAARTLIETTLKHILDECGTPYNAKADLPELFKAAAEQLELDAGKAISGELRKVLGACANVVSGIGALRTMIGDAHGKSKGEALAEPRHARLAIDLAGPMAVFLLEQHESLKESE